MTKEPKTKVDELREALKRKTSNEATESSGDNLLEQIRAAEEEAHNHYDKLLRVMAEFENFKKRINREREEQIQYANEKLLTELLPPLDDLDRVLDHVPPDASEDVKKFVEGVELSRKTLLATLEKFGLKEVLAIGESFDPSRHEAIATIESEAHEPGNVVAVHRKGYWLGERLLRPAMVTVAKTKEG